MAGGGGCTMALTKGEMWGRASRGTLSRCRSHPRGSRKGLPDAAAPTPRCACSPGEPVDLRATPKHEYPSAGASKPAAPRRRPVGFPRRAHAAHGGGP